MQDQFSVSRALALDSAVEAVEMVWEGRIERPLRHLKYISPYCSSDWAENYWHEANWQVCFWHFGFPIREDQGDYILLRVKLACVKPHPGASHGFEARRLEIEGIYCGQILLINGPPDGSLVRFN